MWSRASALALALGASACTAGKAGIHIVDAESALRRANEYGAADRATYEYTLALRYLEKAREEHGYAEYGAAERMAKKSAEWADRAIIYVERGGGLDLESDTFLTDEVPKAAPEVVPPPPEPEPTPGAPSDEELFGPSPIPAPPVEPDPDDASGPDDASEPEEGEPG